MWSVGLTGRPELRLWGLAIKLRLSKQAREREPEVRESPARCWNHGEPSGGVRTSATFPVWLHEPLKIIGVGRRDAAREWDGGFPTDAHAWQESSTTRVAWDCQDEGLLLNSTSTLLCA